MKIVKALAIMTVAMWLHGVEASAQDLCADPVATGSGLVQGVREVGTDTCVWRGVPYAAAPLGELRFRSPRPHPGWEGVRDGSRWGARCVQKGLMELFNADPSDQMAEDCLFLNIWRPARPGPFPVMVWIHGGGYFGGTGNSEFYWGDRLSDFGDVVVVSFNYRLDVFGFFALPELRAEDPHGATGGQGSLDQVAALQWVHDNIKNFGGDPANVTVFGESAGGFSVCSMMATPLARGLFHRAIMESGGCADSVELEAGYEFARAAAAKVGCEAEDLDCLRAVPAKTLIKKAAYEMMGTSPRPHHDGYFLADAPLNLIRAGAYNRVPFIAGYNRDEAAALLKLVPSYYYALPGGYEKRLVKLGFGAEDAAGLIELYPLAEFDGRPVKALGRMLGVDTFFGCDTLDGLVAASAWRPEAYFYRFEYEGFRFSDAAGVCHAMELPYVFNSMDRPPVTPLYGKKQIRAAAGLTETIMAYWVNFAHTGDPNAPGLPEWPRFVNQDPQVLILDADIHPAPIDPLPDRCRYFRELYEREGDLPGLWEALR